jgi:hypothetical protein
VASTTTAKTDADIMVRARIAENSTQSKDDSSHRWKNPLFVAGFTAAIGVGTALLWPLISGGWFYTPAKERDLSEVKEGVVKLGEQLKGVSTDVRAHGEALAAMRASQDGFRAAQEETNTTLRAIILRGVPTMEPSYKPPRTVVEPVRAQADER